MPLGTNFYLIKISRLYSAGIVVRGPGNEARSHHLKKPGRFGLLHQFA